MNIVTGVTISLVGHDIEVTRERDGDIESRTVTSARRLAAFLRATLPDIGSVPWRARIVAKALQMEAEALALVPAATLLAKAAELLGADKPMALRDALVDVAKPEIACGDARWIEHAVQAMRGAKN